MSQKNPDAPVMMNAHFQPCSKPNQIRHEGTNSAAIIAPALEPELKIAVARGRSRLGNHSATVLIEAGKFPASPTPKKLRRRQCMETKWPTNALAIPKMDQSRS